MKTVLFIDKEEKDLWSSFLEYDFLLNEFQEEGLFFVCPWHRDEISVDAAIPDLTEILGDEEDWQAVIVSDLRLPEEELRYDIHFDNPFDFADCYDAAPGDEFKESSHPLVRLAHMLGGLPEKVYIDWHQDENDSLGNLSGLEIAYANSSNHYDILERYRLGLPHPEQIICISPRDVDDAFFDARDRDLATCDEGSLLDFWQRNDYPATARFVAMDRMAPKAEIFDAEEKDDDYIELPSPVMQAENDEQTPKHRSPWFDFWMGVLVILDSLSKHFNLNAYTVYSMRVSIDEDLLIDMLAYRRFEWEAAYKAIELRCHGDATRLRESESGLVEAPATETLIPLSIDQVESEKLLSDTSSVRFFKDSPQSDRSIWAVQKSRIMDEFRELMRAPRRALHDAAANYRACEPISDKDLDHCILDAYEKENLADSLREKEYELACDVKAKPFSLDGSKEKIDRYSRNIEQEIDKRPNRAQSLLSLVLALAVLIVGFLPYCLGLCGGNGFSVSAVVATIVCCLVVVVTWFATMGAMRRRVRKAFLAFNDAMRDVMSPLSNEADRLEKRLSSYATFKKEWSVLDRQNHLDVPTGEAKELGYYSALLKTRIHDVDEITRGDLSLSTQSTEEPQYDWGTLKRLLEDKSFYNIKRIPQEKALRSEHRSKAVPDVPYEFISSVSLEPTKVH